MEKRSLRQPVAVGLVALLALVVGTNGSLAQEKIKKPEPGVPEIFTLEGQFVRIAYNAEGYVSLGYRMANESAKEGEEWMLLEIGLTVRDGVQNQALQRGAISVETPDRSGTPLATQEEYLKGNLKMLNLRATRVTRDSINYFPPKATQTCRIGFFAEVDQRQMVFDQVDLNSRRACLGRVYFHIPGGIKHGQHYLNVKFEKSLVRVPFRILTEEEEKEFSKSWKDIKKEHEKAFKK